ncbi:L,D-transpeptidase family protein [uncultured Paracoccus sp.]|uniref:L,D-transpeptidase family protein n=1 Tax=uncultured Paracoccus sp. TaxID=189685 RepID=UPI0026020C15|nr:L,D-transpeptidase family protein [uncultured Paracoccus sp.]
MMRATLAVTMLAALAACGGTEPASKFRSYSGPPVTQIFVDKSDRRMYLLSGTQVLKGYQVDLGNQPVGPKMFEGDGRTPEGVYFIDRHNPASQYHLSLGISYPHSPDVERALAFGRSAGSDIMIHGRGPYGNAVRKPDWTAGCIAVGDEEIEEIFAMVGKGVPVVIRP